jgi:hypothetical protein
VPTTTETSSWRALPRLVGSWTTEATHPALPGLVVRGTASIEWLPGERFLIYRSSNEHPDFPDSISIIGDMSKDRPVDADASKSAGTQLAMHYFDTRGVFRAYEVSADKYTWRISRQAPGFSQRFTGTFADGGDSIIGMWQLSEDDVHWHDDLEINFLRAPRT